MNDLSKIGKYTVVRVIGEGGMGRVYEATDPVIGRRVAIKVISLGTDTPEARARFFREAQAAGGLSHANIITIHDIGGDAGESPYIVMEFLEGSDLSHQLAGAAMPIEKKIQIAVDICEGLAHAHERGIIHRDIKPANVFITPQGHAKIVDFGLARGEASDITHTGAILGTPNYMAPEQIRGEAIDHRADIFAVGVVLYELFSGRKPFAGDSVASTIYKVLQTEPPLVHTVDSALPPALSNVIQRSIAKDKTQRYPTVRELQDALVALCMGRRTGPIDLTAFTIPMKVARGGGDAPATRKIPWVAIAGGAAAVLVVALVSIAIIGRRPGAEPAAQVANAAPPASAPAQRGSAPEPATPDRPATPDTTPATPPAQTQPPATPPRAEPARDPRRTDQPQQTNVAPRGEPARDSRRADQPRADAARSTATVAAPAPQAPVPQTPAPAPAPKPAEVAPPPAPVPQQAQAPPTTTSIAPAPAVTPPPPAEPRAEARRSPEPAPATPPPAAAAAPPSRPPADAAPRETNAAAIQRVVGDYRVALEARDLAALKRIWPTLGGRQEDAIRAEFDHARTIRVGLSNIQTSVAGSIATVSCRRAYEVTTADGQRLDTASKMTMTLSGRDGAWVIDNIRFEAAQ
jgi:serine/threonine-protein kinase